MNKTKSPSQWQALYRQYETSSLSIAKFCKQQKISTSSFYRYRDNQPVSNNFIQAKVSGADEYGNKELVGIIDGYRESKDSWLELLNDLKECGFTLLI